MGDKVDLGSYNDVASRIAEFRSRHPEGCLRPVDPVQPYRIEQIGSDTVIVYVAAAYRGPDDQLPGIGIAQEAYPGKTPYTRGSELQNAETSAWGRAIVAVLAADTRRGVASHEEVRNRSAENRPAMPSRDAARNGAVKHIVAATTSERLDELDRRAGELAGAGVLTDEDVEELRTRIKERRQALEGGTGEQS